MNTCGFLATCHQAMQSFFGSCGDWAFGTRGPVPTEQRFLCGDVGAVNGSVDGDIGVN